VHLVHGGCAESAAAGERWSGLCTVEGVGVRRFEDLIAWQLADQLHREPLAFTNTPPAANDRDFRNEAIQRQFITNAKYVKLIRLTLRALKANIRLQHSLRRKGLTFAVHPMHPVHPVHPVTPLSQPLWC
jgi:hypothetical protein